MDIGDLTGPDYEIAQMAADGLTVRHIAPRVKLSEREAAARIRSIFAQLGVSNRRELRAKMIAPIGDALSRESRRSSKPKATRESPRDTTTGMAVSTS